MRLIAPALLLFLAACPDPNAPSDAPTDMASSGGGPGGGGPGPAGGAGQPPPPLGNSSFQVAAGEGVKLSGTLSYAGSKTGTIKIDFLKPGEGGAFPTLMHSMSVSAAGPWEVEAPKATGSIGIVAYVDVAGDGPNKDDPGARVAGLVDVQSDPITGLDLAISDTPDLGDFTPGMGTPPAGGAPPGGEGAGGPPPAGGEAGAPPAGGAPPADGAAAPGTPPAGAPPADGAAAPAAPAPQ